MIGGGSLSSRLQVDNLTQESTYCSSLDDENKISKLNIVSTLIISENILIVNILIIKTNS